jgi:hypothetical protein
MTAISDDLPESVDREDIVITLWSSVRTHRLAS